MQLIFVVIAAVIGLACYREALKFEQRHGKGPWGGSAPVWGIVGFLLGLIGALLLVIAERNTKKQLLANAGQWGPPGSGPSGYGPPPGYGAPPAPPAPPAGEWSPPPPPPNWTPPAAPPPAPGPSGPNVDGSDFLPGQH